MYTWTSDLIRLANGVLVLPPVHTLRFVELTFLLPIHTLRFKPSILGHLALISYTHLDLTGFCLGNLKRYLFS